MRVRPASIKYQVVISDSLTVITIHAVNSLTIGTVPLAILSYTTARTGGRVARG
jgi:hypothetical protein